VRLQALGSTAARRGAKRCPGACDLCKLLRKTCLHHFGGAGLLYNGSRCEDSATRAQTGARRSAPAARAAIVDGDGSWGGETSPRRGRTETRDRGGRLRAPTAREPRPCGILRAKLLGTGYATV